MQTFTVQVTDDNGLKALHALEQKHIIRIVDEAEIDFPSLPGKPLSVKAFKIWISDAENTSTVDLKQAKKNGREMIASAAPRKKTTPKTFPVRLSLNALQNIDEITGYSAFVKLQPINAIKVDDEIYKTIERIAQVPLAFKECEEIPTKRKMYRRAVCFSWSVIYRIKNDEILIPGIIHQSRRPSKIAKLRKIK